MKAAYVSGLAVLNLFLLLAVPFEATGQVMGAQVKPFELKDVGIDQNLNASIPLDIPFVDSEGRQVELQDYFSERPVVLALVYYDCPMLCTLVLNGLLKSMLELPFDVADEFDVVTVSFDPKDKPEVAAAKKKSYLAQYRREGAEAGWHFLTGDTTSINKLTKAVGFRYKFVPKTGQFIHASGIMVLTPGGKLSRYFYGIDYDPRDLKLGLMEASKSKIGSPVDQVLLYCFHYDPTTGKYGLVIMNVIRVFGVFTVLGLVSFILIMLRRDKRRKVNAEQILMRKNQ